MKNVIWTLEKRGSQGKPSEYVAYYRKKVNGRQIGSHFFKGGTKTEVTEAIEKWLQDGGFTELVDSKTRIKITPELLAEAGIEVPEFANLGAFLNHWFNQKVANKWRGTTAETNGHRFRKYIQSDFILMNLPFSDKLTGSNMSAFINRIKASPNTRLKVYVLLKAALNSAVKSKKLTENPCHFVADEDIPLESKSRIVGIDKANEQKLIQYVKSDACLPYWRALTLFALDTGARREEILGLQVWDVNFDIREAHIQRAVTTVKGLAAIAPLKTEEADRRLLLTKTTLDALKAILDDSRPPETHIFADFTSPSSPQGVLWTSSRLDKAWRRLLEQAQVKHYGIHACRHTVALRLIRAKVIIPDVQLQLGHKKASITLDTYAKFIEADKEEIHAINAALYGEESAKESVACPHCRRAA